MLPAYFKELRLLNFKALNQSGTETEQEPLGHQGIPRGAMLSEPSSAF